MILNSLELSSFGRFVEKARFTFAPDRPNLITGPNGSGKSTLLAALSAAFVIPHRATGQDIVRWRPWNREVAPRIAVEFESGGRRYRLTKAFLAGRAARLEEERAQGFTLVAEGDAVEQRLGELLGGAPSGGMDARTRQWLLAGVLWIPQNRLLATEVEVAVQERVRGAFGAQTRSPAVEQILREARALYENDWTPTGRTKAASRLTGLREEVERLGAELEDLRGGLDELDEARAGVACLEKEAAGLDLERARSAAEAARLEAEAQKRKEVLEKFEKLRLERARAEAEYRRLQEILEARTTLETRRGEAQRRLGELEGERRKAAEALGEAEAAFRKAYDGVCGEIAAVERTLEELLAPSPATLERMEKLSRERAEAEAKLEGALLHAEIVPETDGRVEVLDGEPQGWMELRRQETARVSGSPRIELRVPGFGRLLLTGPAESATELRERLERLAGEWIRLAEPFGETRLEELRRRRQDADAALPALEQSKELRRRHEEGTSAEAVAREAARKRKEDLDGQMEQQRGDLSRLEEEAKRLQAESRTDGEIRKSLDDLSMQIRGVLNEEQEAQRRLSDFPAELDQRLSRERESAEALEKRLLEARGKLEQARRRMYELQGRCDYSALGDREAQLEQKRRELARAELEARANKLLKETLEAVLDEMQRQILPQVEERAAGILREITGGLAERLALKASSWAPEWIVPSAASVDVAADQISGGEQEQLHLAVRLALADALTEREPFPVVLDDALLSTDDTRLGRILRLLEQRQERMQWLILTCHPERFSELPGAQLIRLDRQGAGA